MGIAKNILSVVVGGMLLGWTLDEMNQGHFGDFAKQVSLKVTRGFGV